MPAALAAWHARDPQSGDLRAFLTLSADLDLDTMGRGPGRWLTHGAYLQADGTHLFPQGVWEAGTLRPFDPAQVHEDARHAWLDEGPDVGGPCGPYRQSERAAHYQQHAAILLEKGEA